MSHKNETTLERMEASGFKTLEMESGIFGIQNRWKYILIGFGMSLVLGLLYAWSIFVMPLEKEFGWNRAQTSLAFTISIVFFVLGMIIGGRHGDKNTPRAVVTIGSTILTLGFFMVSFTSSLPMLYISYGVLCGFGIGFANITPISVAMRWFPDKRGLVSGILVMGFGLAGFLLGSLAGQIIESMSWPWAFRLFGVLSFVICLIGAQFLKEPDKDFVPPATKSADTAQKTSQTVTQQDYNWRQMFKTTTWWIWWTFHLVLFTGGLMIIGHIVPFAIEGGVSKGKAIAAMGMFAVSNGVGRLIIGAMWDRLGRNITMSLDALIMLCGLLCLNYLVPSAGYPLLLISVILIGTSFGGAVPIASAVVSTSFGTKYFGFNYGLATTPLIIGAILGPYLGGYFRTLTQSYELAILASAGLSVIGILAGIIIRDPSGKIESAKA